MKAVYISHSGFFVELEKTAFLFDYMKGEIPETDKKLFVFVSHRHPDHYNNDIFKLRDRGNVAFVLSSDIRLKEKAEDIISLKPNVVCDIEGIKVQTLKSTDEGVAFIISAEGKRIFHAGDLNLWIWRGETKQYNNNMKALFEKYTEPLKGLSFDVGFMPLDPRLEETSFSGLDAYLKIAEFKRIFPMHFWGNYDIIKRYKADRGLSAENVIVIEREGQEFTI
ncbi:MAG: MBL fold metallo-hydrolase [Clostridiales bacterium]|nr:MBL fold metallo-hydrolase [Clostridiales bacterium]